MATFPVSFRSDSDRIHGEHKALFVEITEFQQALDDLACGGEVFANLYGTERLGHHGRRLANLLPDHFQREEATLLPTIAHVSPELEEFAGEVRREHMQLRERLAEFCHVLDRLESGDDAAETVDALKKTGRALAHELNAHIALEESQLGGFL